MPKLKWPELNYDKSYGDIRTLRTLKEQWMKLKLTVKYATWIQRKEKTRKGTQERKIAHYMELYYHRLWDMGFAERHPLNAKQKRGIRWAREQLKGEA